MSEKNVAAHFVTVTPNGEGNPATVKFECRGDQRSECHWYPACECESWSADHEHPYVQHDECWMKGWFDAEGAVYEGADEYDMRDNHVPDDMERSGEITASYEDEYVAWDFKQAAL